MEKEQKVLVTPQTASEEAILSAYASEEMDKQIRQSEILSRIAQYIYDPVGGRVAEIYHDFVVVADQDCDLQRDFDDAAAGKPSTLNGILMYEAYTLEKAKASVDTKTYKDIIKNNHERYAFIEACDKSCDLAKSGFGGLIIDFRRHFTIPPREVYRQIDTLHGAMRRSRLTAPFCEHLQDRLAHYLQRVALPRNHLKPANETA